MAGIICEAISAFGYKPFFCESKDKPKIDGLAGCAPPEEKDSIFSNIEDGAEVMMPVLPLHIAPADPYADNSISVSVNGEKVIEDDLIECGYGSGYWADIPLKEGKNVIVAEITSQNGSSTEQIEVKYTPAKLEKDRNFLYGTHNGHVVVVDLDKPSLLGALKPILEGAGPKNIVFSSDGSRLFVPREGGLEVFDTSTYQLLMSVDDIETGGMAALSPDDLYVFLNRQTIDPFDSQFRVNVLDAKTGEKVLSFYGGCADCRMLAPTEQKDLYLIGPNGDLTAHYASSLYKDKKTIIPTRVNDFRAYPKGGKIGVLSDEEQFHLIDAETDEIEAAFSLPEQRYFDRFVFSSDGNIIYLTGYEAITAFDTKKQTVVWEKSGVDFWGYGGTPSLAMDGKNNKLYGIIPDVCGTEAFIFKAEEGKILDFIPQVQIDSTEIWLRSHPGELK